MSAEEDFLTTLFVEIAPDSKVAKILAFHADDNFSIVVRSKFINEDGNWGLVCNKWLEKFSIQTNSKWLVKSSNATPQRMDYRKVYFCKNKTCKSRIDIKIKKITEHTVKKDKFLLKGLNAEIKVIFNHTHAR